MAAPLRIRPPSSMSLTGCSKVLFRSTFETYSCRGTQFISRGSRINSRRSIDRLMYLDACDLVFDRFCESLWNIG
jgi:hypothetical protein